MQRGSAALVILGVPTASGGHPPIGLEVPNELSPIEDLVLRLCCFLFVALPLPICLLLGNLLSPQPLRSTSTSGLLSLQPSYCHPRAQPCAFARTRWISPTPFSPQSYNLSKEVVLGGGMRSNGGGGKKKLRTIRLSAKPPPPWGNLVPNPRNMATAETIIPANNMVAN